MPPRGVKSPKRARQYEKIKASARKNGRGKRASEIAARTVNKQRSKAGETKSAPRRSSAGKTSRKKSSSTSRSRSGGSRSRSSTSRSRSSRGKKS